jgi:2'-5' RNA ligase
VPDRVFVAIDLSERARASLTATTAALLRADPSWLGEKPVASALLHVTLAFIGPVPDTALDEMIGRLRHATSAVDGFDLRIAGVRAIPSVRRATMVWAALDDPRSRAALLAERIADAAGLTSTSRPFRPHVTLLRARRPRPLESAAIALAQGVLSASGKVADRTVSVRSATVYSSTLDSSGPAYARLAMLRLGGETTSARTD